MLDGRILPTAAAVLVHIVLTVLMVLTIESYMDFFLVCAFIILGLALVHAAVWCIRTRGFLPWHTAAAFIVCAFLQTVMAEFTPFVSADGLGSGFALLFYYIALAVSCAALLLMQICVWIWCTFFGK